MKNCRKIAEPFIAISERPTQPDKSGECVTFPRIYRHIHSPRLRHCNKVQRLAKNIFSDYSQDDFGRNFEAIYDASLIAKKTVRYRSNNVTIMMMMVMMIVMVMIMVMMMMMVRMVMMTAT